VFNRAGAHELDASIMDGATRRAGAVAGVRSQKNPIEAARLVMERTPHILLSGDEADKFGRENGLDQVSQDYYYTERRFRDLQDALVKLGLPPLEKPAYAIPANTSSIGFGGLENIGGTVGCVALDSYGNLAAATSTGGMSGKMAGRVGDSPIIGAGTYADNETCAVSGTGKGEEFIRHSVAARVGWLMEGRGLSVDDAVKHCLTDVLKPGDGGLIAVDRQGHVSMHSTTEAMPRGVADSSGRFETAISIDR
jgi:beta-aspartyl-peptidase (threonine type)